MSERMMIDDLLACCYSTLEEAREAVAALPRTDPDRHIFFCIRHEMDMSVYIRAANEERAEVIFSVWYADDCFNTFKIRPDACPGCCQSFDAMIQSMQKGSSRELDRRYSAVESFLLTNLAAEAPVAC